MSVDKLNKRHVENKTYDVRLRTARRGRANAVQSLGPTLVYCTIGTSPRFKEISQTAGLIAFALHKVMGTWRRRIRSTKLGNPEDNSNYAMLDLKGSRKAVLAVARFLTAPYLIQ